MEGLQRRGLCRSDTRAQSRLGASQLPFLISRRDAAHGAPWRKAYVKVACLVVWSSHVILFSRRHRESAHGGKRKSATAFATAGARSNLRWQLPAVGLRRIGGLHWPLAIHSFDRAACVSPAAASSRAMAELLKIGSAAQSAARHRALWGGQFSASNCATDGRLLLRVLP